MKGGGWWPKKFFAPSGFTYAVAGWLGSYGGEDSPADISRGLFAGEIGTMRLLDLRPVADRLMIRKRISPTLRPLRT
jgi:hypothetical protein